MKFLMMVCVPKPTPIASAPPRKANTVSGMRARFSVSASSTNAHSASIQRRTVRACAASIEKRVISRRSK